MILTMALLDMIGVASIMPFMAVLANPEIIQTNAMLNAVYQAASHHLGINTTEQFLFALGMLVFVLLVVSLAFKALTTYAKLRFVQMRNYSISMRLVEGYLHQPYSWFLSRHSADLGKSILSEVGQVISGGMTPMMNLIAHGAIAIALLTLLILIDPKLALIVGLTLATAYALIFKATRGLLGRIGKERVKANQRRFTAVSEAFGASKEVKVGGLEQAYIKRFAGPAQTFARHQATAQVISQLPRFALEAIAFGGMLLVVLYLMAQSGSFASALPIIALYAFAGYRLMPALQQIYGAVTQLRFAGPALDALHADLMSLQPAYANPSQDAIALKEAITLNQIQFCYPNAPQPALKNLSLTIPAKSTVGLVGATGSGKTTTVDLILGLLEAQEGTLAVDGQAITEHNRRAWQRAIGYVPQQIYLADDTVAANIAFGLQEKDIDQAAVERAAKIANLHEFVANELPQQYQTTVGERGVRLSGGQRQRIGIARALYDNPQVLILDEATSALDNLTEQAVMEAVHNLGHEITIILIAHRLSTVKSCDTIFLLEKGELKAQGAFDELTHTNARFRAMAANH
ncbi:ABC transporter ATP-binding protein [Ectothiorhodosinus mongolicus]|nr:ABC transporter ATP-binding protein [Ectothiorhodosinus mongolicus]